MKKAFYCIPFLLVLVACSDKYRSLSDIDQAPVIGLSRDTIFVRVNDTTTVAGLLYILTTHTNDNLLQISFSDTSNGKVSVYYDKHLVTDNLLPVIGDSTRVYIVAHSPGTYEMTFTLVDRFNKSASRKLIVSTPTGTVPKARFSATRDAALVYTIDGSASTDPYGYIIQYHYTIDGIDIYSAEPVIHQVFYRPGQHSISLMVENDVQQYSQPVPLTLNVQ